VKIPASILIAILAMSSACAGAERVPDLARLVALNTAALGGREAIEATASVEYGIRITEKEFSVSAVYVADRKGRMRIDVYDKDTRVFTEALDGRNAWQWTPANGAQPSSAAGKAGLQHGIRSPGKIFGLHEMTAIGNQLESLAGESVDGKQYDVLKLTYTDGEVTYLYLDGDSHLITRTRDVRALHPDVDSSTKWIENVHEDFCAVNGVMHPWSSRQVDLKTHEILQTTRVTSLQVNLPLADETFAFDAVPLPRPAALSPGDRHCVGRHVGTSHIKDKDVRKVVKAGNLLFAIRSIGARYPLSPASESRLFREGLPGRLRFDVDATGKVLAMEVDADGSGHDWQRSEKVD
jgi:hypothetical protein